MISRKVKIISLLIIIPLLLVSGVASFFYFGYMSEGNRAGVVVKISNRGYFFKTWEGELNLNYLGNKPDIFNFSVEDNQTKVINILKEVALSGERISVTYIERHKTFFWRGDTKFFITEVVRQNKDDFKNYDNGTIKLNKELKDEIQLDTINKETKNKETFILSKETSL